MRKAFFFLFLFFLPAAAALARDSVLLFSYFTGNGEDGLHLAWSEDGLHFEALNDGRPVLKPTTGKDKLMRDPCIIRGADGKFHMVWTVSWGERGVGYASSEDLVHWSAQRYLPVMEDEPQARNCWAPEIAYDPGTGSYMICWATTIPGRFPETDEHGDDGYNHRMYYTTTKDFRDFSKTKLLYDPGFNVIDATVKKYTDGFVMFLKNETRTPPEKNIRLAFSEHLTGPYGPAGPPVTGEYWAEGPTATRLDGRWIVYFDKYTEGQMGAVASPDLEQWTDISEKISFPEGTRHGTVLKITRAELERLQKELAGK